MIEKIRDFIESEAEKFGATDDSYYVERNNTGAKAFENGGAFFGFISPEEPDSGPYHDFSLVVFPCKEEKSWLICLGVGSQGFKNDYELSTYPGIRRLFSKLVDKDGICQTNISDIETIMPKSFRDRPEIEYLNKTIDKYKYVLPVCQIINPSNEDGEQRISAFVAAYARMREWPSNEKHRTAVSKALAPYNNPTDIDDIKEIKLLIEERKYVVLQGAPGTGKTWSAREIVKEMEAESFFIQFHAETSYSDFIYGIRPNLSGNELGYTEYIGVLPKAIKYALENEEKKVVLIIDEINRANLSNVLGQVFYLFEHKITESDIEIEVTPNLSLTKLPSNLFVIATMNTADRSLAIIDFALRRRFAWYEMQPKPISIPTFQEKHFNKFQQIFEWYATSEELNLQPGQGYFIANSEKEMKNRVRYELLPLIKEYLQEGLLLSATEEFNNYFEETINKSLFE